MGNHRFAVKLLDSFVEAQHIEALLADDTHEFGGRTLPHHDQVQWIRCDLQRGSQALDQGSDAKQYRDCQGDAQGRHEGRTLANLEVSDVVGDRNRHR